MSITSPEVGEAFRIRVQSSHNLNPSQKWSNHWLIFCVVPTNLASLRNAANKILNFHDSMNLDTVRTEYATISTYSPDSNPYDANEFTQVDYNSLGSRDSALVQLLPLETCLYIKKATPTGRVGKLFLRGVLGEADVSFAQSGFALTNPSAIQAIFDDAVSLSLLSDMFGGTTGDDFALALPTGASDPSPSRVVTGLDIGGVKNVNMNKRYYNRGV